MSEPILRLEGLVKDYKEARGVGPLHLELKPGVHGLVGPNGAGKTTLIQTMLGFQVKSGGRGFLFEHEIGVEVDEIRKRVGYMAEFDVTVPGMNGVRVVRLAAELAGMDPSEAVLAADLALDRVGLGAERFGTQSKLSTGQRQQLKLAAAIVHKPDLLILDEPTNGLDPISRKHMLQIIEEEHRQRGASILLCTHILPDVEAVCEDAIILREGRIVGVETNVDTLSIPTHLRAKLTTGQDVFARLLEKHRIPFEQDQERFVLEHSDVPAILKLTRGTSVQFEELRGLGDDIQQRAIRRMVEP